MADRTGQDVEGSTNVRVVCRLRPMNDREKKAGTVPAASASTERKEVAVVRTLASRQMRSTFHFDNVLTSFSTQEEVYKATLEPLVTEVLGGFEATAFAYGQTGTGKTYTMEGDLASEDGRGLVPRAAAAVIDRLSHGEYTEHSITCSYLEIYNEELSDLLAPPQHQVKLDLKDVGGGRGVCCIGLSEVPVTSLEEILDLIHRAQERRRIAETRLNARSSRSHCIFTMKVRCRRRVSVGELENVGKLHLVDLAGSECAKKASFSSVDERTLSATPSHSKLAAEEERERRSINQSLLTLGRVIASLRENSGRVPYRDSKLTRLLQDALGGKCKTVIIATLSPAMNAVDETISTLSYAEQASGIKNRPVASSLLRSNRTTASEVRLDSSALSPNSGCGATDWNDLELKVVYLTQEVEEAQAALARKYQETLGLLERAEGAEEQLSVAHEDLQEARLHIDSHRQQMQGLLDVISGATKAHVDTISSRPPALKNVLEALKACLQSRGQVATASLIASTEELDSTQARLEQVSQSGKAKCSESLDRMDSELRETWDQQHQKVEEATTALKGAATKQRDGCAAEALESAIRSAATSLNEELVTSVAKLSQAREDISCEVDALKAHRASEQKIVSLLTGQRDTLLLEVSTTRQQLASARTTLAATKAEITEAVARQEKAHARAMEKITSVMSSEFAALAHELHESSTSACIHLDEVTAIATTVEETVVSAQQNCASTGQEAVDEAGSWSQDVDSRCCTIGVAQEQALRYAQHVDQANSAAAIDFQNLQALNSKWGAVCDEVAVTIDGAKVSMGELCCMDEKLRPKWAEMRSICSEAVETWAGGCREVARGLDSVSSGVTTGTDEIGSLTSQSAEELDSALKHAALWLEENKTHEIALVDLSKLATAAATAAEKKQLQDGIDFHITEIDVSAAPGVSNVSDKTEAFSTAASSLAGLSKAPLLAFDEARVPHRSSSGETVVDSRKATEPNEENYGVLAKPIDKDSTKIRPRSLALQESIAELRAGREVLKPVNA